MSFLNWLEEHADQEMEIEIPPDDDIDKAEEHLLRITDSVNKLATKQAEINARGLVCEFVEMDRLLKELGYEDKDERMRIIEIIF